MSNIVIKQPQLTQVMDIWSPRYSDKYAHYGEQVVLLHEGKLRHNNSKYVIVTFSKAKGLAGLRFAISRAYALEHELGTNGAAAMRIVPMSHLSSYITGQEDNNQVRQTIESFGWWTPKKVN